MVQHRQQVQKTQELKVELEERNNSYTDLVSSLQHTRQEYERRLQRERREYEDKVDYLLKQLRSAEVRLYEKTAGMRKPT
jgi:hypothetical protein